jgi:hypothetical protein
MKRTGYRGAVAALLFLCGAALPASAAAPGDLEPEATVPVTASPIRDYDLDTEMVVRDWVLCVSQAVAEKLVHARETGVDAARSTYAELNAAKSCGRFSELRVILQERLYASRSGADARAFGALVDFAGEWASAYVVYGLPAE